jgi:hypothetical protein
MNQKALLPGRAEQVQHDVVGDRDTAEVQRNGGGALALDPGKIVDPAAELAEHLLGAQWGDLTDRADECRLPHAEAGLPRAA